MNKNIKHLALSILFLLAILPLLSACQDATPLPVTPLSTATNQPPSSPTPRPEFGSTQPATGNKMEFGFTYQNSDGNRVISGTGNFPANMYLDIPLPGTPVWLVATASNNDAVWTVSLSDGRTISYLVKSDGSEVTELSQIDLPAGMPVSQSGDSSLVLVSDPDETPLSHPVFLPQSGLRAYITQGGQLNFINRDDLQVASLDVHALPDARLLQDEADRLLLLTNPTEIYDHGVLGDQIEAASITLVETLPHPAVIANISLKENEVVEGIAPIWADLNGDHQREIIVTVSDHAEGAGIVVFSESGERIAEGPKMGRPYRWRHQISVNEFGPGNEIELAVVRTPHIGGTVEYYRLTNGELSVVAEFPGVTSHSIGSRNLDYAASGDIDSDGVIEMLVLNTELTEYIALQRTSAGVQEAWRLPLGGALNTNLAGVTLPGGIINIGIGRQDDVLRIWLPDR